MEQLETAFRTNRITLRLPKGLFEELRREAEERDLPLNSYVTKVLNRHVAFSRSFEMMPSVLTSQVLFAAIISTMDESSMAEIARLAPRIARKMSALGGWEYDVDNTIERYFGQLGKYGGWYQFRHKVERSHYTLVFETGMGRKWARFVALHVREVLESLKAHITDESVEERW